MTRPSDKPRSETYEADGHVIMIGCRLLPDANKWEPTASVRPSWALVEERGSAVTITSKAEQYQDSPEDAIGVARAMVEAWLQARDPNGIAKD